MARKMRDSGVEWIGEVPEGWEIRRLKTLATILRGGSPRPIDFYLSDVGYNWVKISDATRCGKIITETSLKIKASGLSKTRMVHSGDLILTNSMSFGTPYIMGIDGCIHDGWVALENIRDVSKEYLYYYLSSCACKTQFQLEVSGGVVQNLNVDKIGNVGIPHPPLPEQRKIADYLDEKCAAIDGAISELKSGIEDFKAWKKAIIFEAVTGKTNVFAAKNAKVAKRKMRDSGIPWIGEIPEGWEVSRVKRHYKITLGKMLCASSTEDATIKAKYICAANVHFDGVSLAGLKEMWFSQSELLDYSVEEGDLLVVEGGAGAGGAAICPATSETIGIQNSIMMVRGRHFKDNRYLRYLLESFVKAGYVDFICNKATIPHFTKEKLGNMPIVVPPLPEQQAIADYLDEKCAAIDALVAEKEKLITDLEAYKKSLIFELVTGKREVA